MQRADASWDCAHSADRNGYGGVAGATWPQISARAQGRDESAELSRSKRVRARAICARALQLHVAVPDAAVKAADAIPSEVENGAVGEAATWTGRPEGERTGSQR